ncbi:hypothetical protein SUDANB145_07183 (plasmid) [Streptomyces sp. enrichment culture]|uniref:hypothetical protein n=1 Tax=Streptomyces sp. enrichment culture TaxID=1795815 RepID=UPI003F579324
MTIAPLTAPAEEFAAARVIWVADWRDATVVTSVVTPVAAAPGRTSVVTPVAAAPFTEIAFPTTSAGHAADADVRIADPAAIAPSVTIRASPAAPYTDTSNTHGSNGRYLSAASAAAAAVAADCAAEAFACAPAVVSSRPVSAMPCTPAVSAACSATAVSV